jgi:hypothetical protein
MLRGTKIYPESEFWSALAHIEPSPALRASVSLGFLPGMTVTEGAINPMYRIYADPAYETLDTAFDACVSHTRACANYPQSGPIDFATAGEVFAGRDHKTLSAD